MVNEISEKIRNLRKDKNLTLKEMSEKTGLSVSFLSQVENNTSSLAITSLKKIADALCIPIAHFFKSPPNHTFLVKSEEKSVFKIEGSNSEFARLSGDFSERCLESVMITIPPKEKHGHKFNHPGEEFIHVLDGAIIVDLDGKEYLVESGDSFHFPSTIPHILINPLNEPAKILTVVTPIIF
ncbi:helix-turn-helix domain-containing protein [Tepidibacter aestuarii]|uniref:helix-turn-helix domain-containing protein n=1 Tax=Tepidibacter aestuarii TaxID=2925782 RepID=UPI0020BDDA78|nr:XRE family transcriptional regulator [Tepidibacter aestuarii]CAH2212541.1 Transcriptional regulator, XRE family with cupin sensor [Tepidibacter aestuarii]